MKYLNILLLALIAISCNKNTPGQITFSGTAPGIKTGTFIVKTLGDSTMYGQNIKDGKLPENKHLLKFAGYYNLNVTDEVNNDNHEPFEVYLQKGTYTITTEAGKLYKYPKITSPSKIQEQLSAFYSIEDKLASDTRQEITQYNKELKAKGDTMAKNDYINLLGRLSEAQNKMLQTNVLAFKEFLKQYPNSEVSTHLMEKLNYEDDPASYYAIYQTLTSAAKNTDEGKEIGEKLKHLIKLVVGAKAPAIVGKTLDGKPFDLKSINKKLILIDFWRASNDFSRRNHEQLISLLNDIKDKSSLGILSISLDTKPDWWTNAVKEDNMTWPQVCDLKGDDSPNAANWSITSLPTYYLVDSNWKIVGRNLNIGNISLEVTTNLNKR